MLFTVTLSFCIMNCLRFYRGHTPLHCSDFETCRLLLDSRADVNAKGNGYFRLSCFILCVSPQACLNRLLFTSAETPLHEHAENGHLETCRLLIDSKADAAATTWYFTLGPHARLPLRCLPHILHCSDGKTALRCAIEHRQDSIEAFLRSLGAPE